MTTGIVIIAMLQLRSISIDMSMAAIHIAKNVIFRLTNLSQR